MRAGQEPALGGDPGIGHPRTVNAYHVRTPEKPSRVDRETIMSR
ncbi:hypothetical protein HNR40_004105 [Nonomuraea endophytica]|uniref:Uncharacterized protein n=1 Tax=Nonomuraea endophytica TaxID=714136 RepID=A0A7W8A437_9ACTN|nr:hypothetical protein [Nonomuraea endophytica]